MVIFAYRSLFPFFKIAANKAFVLLIFSSLLLLIAKPVISQHFTIK